MKPYFQDDQVTLWHGDALEVAKQLPDGAADCIVTSPPYFGLRDYKTQGQYGLEGSPGEYVERMRVLFLALRPVLSGDGTLWLNLGDSYAPSKDLYGIPWQVAFALQSDGWILRNAIIWNKPNAMPESVTDRLSGRYEHVFMFSKSRRYWFDLDAVREPHTAPPKGGLFKRDATSYVAKASGPQGKWDGEYNPAGRNPGDVWTIPTQPFSAAHFAVFPVALPQRCIAACCKPGGTVLDPFSGSGTTGLAAQRLGRKYIGIDLNKEYLDLSLETRLKNAALDFGEAS